LSSVGGAGGELSMGGDGRECGKHHDQNHQRVVTEFGEAEDCGESFHRYWLDPLPALKCAKSSKEKT
jgi:hypothetical protein